MGMSLGMLEGTNHFCAVSYAAASGVRKGLKGCIDGIGSLETNPCQRTELNKKGSNP